MTQPVNFDSVGVDTILADWLCALRDQAVEALVVLGPNPLGERDAREVLAVLFVIDWMTGGAWWVQWPALGVALYLAWRSGPLFEQTS